MPSPPRFRFSVRSLLLAVSLTAVALSWFCVCYLEPYRTEGRTLDQLQSTGGAIHTSAREPEWFWALLDEKAAQKGVSLVLSDTNVGDNELAVIGTLTDLGGLYLDKTNVTDEGLQHVADLKGLTALSLRRTSVTRLPSLAGMNKLVQLDLAFTQVEEVDLNGLVALENLSFRATRITDEFLVSLPELPNLKTLDIAGAPGQPMQITDRGLGSLTKKKLPSLQNLYLYQMQVSDEAISRLKEAFPGIKVVR